jgi:exoribonuclease R
MSDRTRDIPFQTIDGVRWTGSAVHCPDGDGYIVHYAIADVAFAPAWSVDARRAVEVSPQRPRRRVLLHPMVLSECCQSVAGSGPACRGMAIHVDDTGVTVGTVVRAIARARNCPEEVQTTSTAPTRR